MTFKERYLRARQLGGAPHSAFQSEALFERTQFDFIVLGAGSAGSIVAGNLAKAYPELSIALIEAGPPVSASDKTVWDPTQWVLVSEDKNLEWGYKSTPQPGLDNRVIGMGRARGLGGCALHNAMVYVRGGSKGYNNWAQNLGCPGWDYADNVPYFDQVESQVHVTIAQQDPFIADLIGAAENNGLVYNHNYNENLNEACVSPFQFAIASDGRRETTYSTYLEAVYPNLIVATGVTIERILIEGKTARGVVVSSGCLQLELSATREIILSTGAIGSPHLLMLSGIGPAAALTAHGIKVELDAPGVGQNFQDDLFVTAAWRSKKPMPPQPYGLMGAVLFGNSSNNSGNLGTDIECSLAAGTMAGMGLPPSEQQSYWIYPNLQLLKSRGTVSLASSDPYTAPIIDPKYLSDPEDMINCLDGLKLALAIGADPAMVDWMGDELLPASGQGDSDLEAYIRQSAGTCYHYAGTCRMGSDAQAVTTPDLRVSGIDGLRVIDASVIPQLVSGNCAAATMMIAEKGSQFILEGNP